MDHSQPEHDEGPVEAVLRRSRPAPDRQWLDGLEQRLLPSDASRISLWRRPHLRLGAALAAGIATVIVALSLAGLGPLGGGASNVRAKDECRTVHVSRIEQVKSVEIGRDGQPRVVTRPQRVQRYERRCR